MRAVLRTVAHCHYNHILHRDVKPGNFMLLEDDPLSPVKAIGQLAYFLAACILQRSLALFRLYSYSTNLGSVRKNLILL